MLNLDDIWNLENSFVLGDISYPYSRFIASWVKVHTKKKKPVYFGEKFKQWLKQIGVPDKDAKNIYTMATMGKLELEESAMFFNGFYEPKEDDPPGFYEPDLDDDDWDSD